MEVGLICFALDRNYNSFFYALEKDQREWINLVMQERERKCRIQVL